MSEAQRRRLRAVTTSSAVVYLVLTVLAVGLVEQQPGWAVVVFLISLPFAAVLFKALGRGEARDG